MTSFTSYRTKLLSEARARQFAACLRKNSRAAFVAVMRSTRAKSDDRWYVQWQPSNESRQRALVDAQDSARAQRGCEGTFTFLKDVDGSFLCFSHESGNVYSVREHSCDCPDATHRLAGTSIRCKHSWALRNASPEELGPAPVIDRKFDQAQFDAIFA